MDSSDVIQLLTLLILIFLSAFFSSAETALTTANKIRMKTLADEGDSRAATFLKVVGDQGKMLSAILIGNNIVNLSASSLATVFATRLWGSAGAGIATGVLTLLILVFGEISPKTMATIYAEPMALGYAGIIHGLMVVLTPVIVIVNKLSLGFLRLMRVDPNKKSSAITESELRVIVDVSHQEGVIESEERKMINNVVDFGDSLAKDVMIPRIDMTFIDVNASYDEVIATIRENMYTRMPVYEESTDNVIGLINIKDLLLYDKTGPFCVKDFLREAYYTYEHKKTSELFVDMRTSSINLAIVLDEYGATAGMVTLEDLLEEIVGEIRDEYDEEEAKSIQKLGDREYLVEGSMKLDDLNDMLEIDLESEDYDSLGGYIIGLLDRLPEVGETVTSDGFIYVVDAVDKNRISWVHMYLPENNEEEAEAGEENEP